MDDLIITCDDLIKADLRDVNEIIDRIWPIAAAVPLKAILKIIDEDEQRQLLTALKADGYGGYGDGVSGDGDGDGDGIGIGYGGISVGYGDGVGDGVGYGGVIVGYGDGYGVGDGYGLSNVYDDDED